jgi:hypothetical protein
VNVDTGEFSAIQERADTAAAAAELAVSLRVAGHWIAAGRALERGETGQRTRLRDGRQRHLRLAADSEAAPAPQLPGRHAAPRRGSLRTLTAEVAAIHELVRGIAFEQAVREADEENLAGRAAMRRPVQRSRHAAPRGDRPGWLRVVDGPR